MYGIILIATGTFAAAVFAAHLVIRGGKVRPRPTALDPTFTASSLAASFGVIAGVLILITGMHWAAATAFGVVSGLVFGGVGSLFDAYLHPLTAAELDALQD